MFSTKSNRTVPDHNNDNYQTVSRDAPNMLWCDCPFKQLCDPALNCGVFLETL